MAATPPAQSITLSFQDSCVADSFQAAAIGKARGIRHQPTVENPVSRWRLSGEATPAAYWNFEIKLESAGNKELQHYRERGSYDMVVTGYHHRGLSGVGVALAIRRVNPAQRIAVITAESSVVVRSMQRKLRDIPLIGVKNLIDALLKMGRAKIAAADRPRESALPSSIRKRIKERRKSGLERWKATQRAFFELRVGAILARASRQRRHRSFVPAGHSTACSGLAGYPWPRQIQLAVSLEY